MQTLSDNHRARNRKVTDRARTRARTHTHLPVCLELGVDIAGAFGRLCDGEPHPSSFHGGPIDAALVVRYVRPWCSRAAHSQATVCQNWLTRARPHRDRASRLHVCTLARTEGPGRAGGSGCVAVAALNVCGAWAESLAVGATRAGQRGLLALAVAFGGSLGAAENRGVARAEAAAVSA